MIHSLKTVFGIKLLLLFTAAAFAGESYAPPSTPAGLISKGYDSHIELKWNHSIGAGINGYAVARSLDGGNTFDQIALLPVSDTIYIDHVRAYGPAVNALYYVTASNIFNERSVSSDTVQASTREFTDEELLDMLQEYTFRYFYDFAHPASGMIRERNTSGNTVTTGGTGFGIMALLVGIERGFITREQGVLRLRKILDFLENADRFHGAWPHWMDGITGEVIPFSQYDNGGDLVETGFLVQGLLTARQYFNQQNPGEQAIVQKITELWEGVEWDWYRRNNSDVLYWHWSPDYNWQMNMQIRGWNEASIVYMLAIASPTHGVPASLWHSGWAGGQNYVNGKTFYNYRLDVGWDRGGPLFFAHYSFLGFDPRNKRDEYANYFNNNRNHTLINRAWCIDNPLNFEGYNENCWGLTASDDPYGYMAHEPVAGRDNGTITPSASLSSMPYTPEESMNAFKYMYRELGSQIWGSMGFYDAFNIDVDWYTTAYLAIDQGPVIGMIENYRSGLLWNNFMANEEIQPMLDAIGFTEDIGTGIQDIATGYGLMVIPNPVPRNGYLSFSLDHRATINLVITDVSGHRVATLAHDDLLPEGTHYYELGDMSLRAGAYLIRLYVNGLPVESVKAIIY